MPYFRCFESVYLVLRICPISGVFKVYIWRAYMPYIRCFEIFYLAAFLYPTSGVSKVYIWRRLYALFQVLLKCI